MIPEMQTTLLNTYPPKLIATILKALREQLKENDLLNAVAETPGPVPEIPIEYTHIVGWSNKGKPLRLRQDDTSRAHFQGTVQRLVYVRLPAEDRQKYGEDNVAKLVESLHGTQDASHIERLDYVNLICGNLEDS